MSYEDKKIAMRILEAMCLTSIVSEWDLYRRVIQDELDLSDTDMEKYYSLYSIYRILEPEPPVQRLFKGIPIAEYRKQRTLEQKENVVCPVVHTNEPVVSNDLGSTAPIPDLTSPDDGSTYNSVVNNLGSISEPSLPIQIEVNTEEVDTDVDEPTTLPKGLERPPLRRAMAEFIRSPCGLSLCASGTPLRGLRDLRSEDYDDALDISDPELDPIIDCRKSPMPELELPLLLQKTMPVLPEPPLFHEEEDIYETTEENKQEPTVREQVETKQENEDPIPDRSKQRRRFDRFISSFEIDGFTITETTKFFKVRFPIKPKNIEKLVDKGGKFTKGLWSFPRSAFDKKRTMEME
jgi:hypothetical protein